MLKKIYLEATTQNYSVHSMKLQDSVAQGLNISLGLQNISTVYPAYLSYFRAENNL